MDSLSFVSILSYHPRIPSVGEPVRQLVEPITMSAMTTLVAFVAERPDVPRVFPAQPPVRQVMHLKMSGRLATVTAPAFGFG